MRILIVGLILFHFVQSYSQQVVNEKELDDFIIQTMKKDSIPGLAAAIFVNKQPVWMKGYGYADREDKILFTPNTIMNIASITKTFTGVCVMKAVEDKLVSLDEDINRYLPFRVVNPQFPQAKITLRMLATHTSSIIDRQAYVSSYHFGGDPKESLGEWLENYFTPKGKNYSPNNFTPHLPGTRNEYSNIGAALAGYIVECVTGEPLNRYSKRIIFEPLKMNDSGWLMSEVDMSNHARGYYKEDDSIIVVDHYGVVTYPDGGVRTSVSDLSKYFSSMLNGTKTEAGRILNEESVKTLLTPHFTSSNKPKNLKLKDDNYGVFWNYEEDDTQLGHSGGDPGVDTEMYYNLSKEVGIILFVNISSDSDRKSQEIKSIPEISKRLWKEAEVIKKLKSQN